MNLTAVVVDDELLARENMKLMLANYCEGIEVIGEADGVESAVIEIESKQPNIVFVDIRMPSGAEGFDLIKQINTDKIVVVFVTAFKDYAIRAFNANALHYILKPIDVEDLQNAIAKIKSFWNLRLENPEQEKTYSELVKSIDQEVSQKAITRLAIHHSKGIKIVQVKDIVRIEADSNCSKLFFSDDTSYLDTRTLKVYEELLTGSNFFRAHKSHIFNFNYLKEYFHTEGHRVELMNGDTVPISRGKLSEFLTSLREM